LTDRCNITVISIMQTLFLQIVKKVLAPSTLGGRGHDSA
jgi:hypothetical protein